MPSRAGKPKSHHGCTRCKQRRVKCDETAPCQHCVRRREQCSLSIQANSSVVLDSNQLRSSYLQYDPTSFLTYLTNYPCHQQPSEPAAWAQDLFLISHFTTSTVRTLSPRKEMLELWHNVILEEAVLCPFLLHGMLALSALHLASLRPSQRSTYEQCCRQHQNEAIPEYRKALLDIRFENAGPVLAMAYLVSALSFTAISDNALRKQDPCTGTAVTLDEIIAVFTVVRGIHAILRTNSCMDYINNSPYNAALTGHKPVRSPSFSLPAETQQRYRLLRTDCLDNLVDSPDSPEYGICVEAVALLEEVHQDVMIAIAQVGPGGFEHSCLLKWVALVSPEFVTLLQRRHTASLIILGDFAALFDFEWNRWFLKNWAKNALKAIRDVIDPRASEWLIES